jgi:hypothetical protein
VMWAAVGMVGSADIPGRSNAPAVPSPELSGRPLAKDDNGIDDVRLTGG